jgi:hypothetical protein
MNKMIKKLITTLVLITVFSAKSYALTADEINDRASILISERKYEEAIKVIMPSYRQNRVDDQSLFLLGLSYREMTNYNKSIELFEELLTKNKRSGRIKLELALSYFKDYKFSKAKKLLLEVKDSNPPKAVINKVDSLLSAIKTNDKQFSFYVSAGYLFDDNANAGTSVDEVEIYNLPFRLSNDAKESRDTARTFSGTVAHNKMFNKSFGIGGNLNLSRTDYDDLDELDTLHMSSSYGIKYNIDKFSFYIPLTYNALAVDTMDEYYYYMYGTSPSMSYRINNNLVSNTTLSYNKKTFKASDIRDSDTYGINESINYYFKTAYVGINAGYYTESANLNIYSNNSKNIGLVAVKKFFNNKLSVSLSPSYGLTIYDSKEIAYNKIRKDRALYLRSGIGYNIYKNLTLSANYSYTRNNSTIKMYEYRKNQISMNLGYQF